MIAEQCQRLEVFSPPLSDEELVLFCDLFRRSGLTLSELALVSQEEFYALVTVHDKAEQERMEFTAKVAAAPLDAALAAQLLDEVTGGSLAKHILVRRAAESASQGG